MDERSLVVDALRDPESLGALTARDLDLTLRLLRRARLLGRIAAYRRETGRPSNLPRAARDQLDGSLVFAEAQQRTALWELDRVRHALRGDSPSPLIVLKGCAYALARLPNAAGRPFADVDLLIPRDRLAEAERQLRAQGWASAELSPHDDRYYRQWAHELPPLRHAERGIEVDLHHNLVMSTGRFRPAAQALFDDARALPDSSLSMLAPVDMVLHSMTHLMAGSDLADALRELVDIDALLRHFGEHEPCFWDSFWPRAQRLDLARPAWYSLRHAHRWLGTPVPDAVLAASQRAAPPGPIAQLTDRLMPLALFPPHPDRPGTAVRAARALLYLRSHWNRMPAPMLARHLAHKLLHRVHAAHAGLQGEKT